jgi:alkylation response protein AidB-like acyl-CoA dehydrogenase
MASPGIVIRPLREITGDDLFNEVFFDEVFVPDEMVVGRVNDGWRLARTTLANERVAMAAGTALGNPMEELLRTVADVELDAAEHDRLGALIVSAQVGSLLDQRIAQVALGGGRAQGALPRTPEVSPPARGGPREGSSRDPGAQSSARKLIGVRYRQALAELRMELSEGAGAVENPAVHDFLNTRCLTIAGGTEQILLTLAGERLLGLPR